MKNGTKVRHKTKGMVETVVGSCKVKVNGVWVDGIVYEGNDVNTGEPMTFVRTKEDFENDFVDDGKTFNVNNGLFSGTSIIIYVILGGIAYVVLFGKSKN